MPDKLTFETQEYMGQQRRRALALWMWLSMWMEGDNMVGLVLTKVTIKAAPDDNSDVLVVLNARDENGLARVAFSSGPTPFEALENAKRKQEMEGLKWREDQPFPRSTEKREAGRKGSKGS